MVFPHLETKEKETTLFYHLSLIQTLLFEVSEDRCLSKVLPCLVFGSM